MNESEHDGLRGKNHSGRKIAIEIKMVAKDPVDETIVKELGGDEYSLRKQEEIIEAFFEEHDVDAFYVIDVKAEFIEEGA